MGERRGTRGLELWCKRMTEGYPGVKIDNMTTSWRDGLAFCAIIHHFRPDLIEFSKLDKNDVYSNNELAFRIAEDHFGIPALLEPEDMVEYAVPDRLSILTYLSQFYKAFATYQSNSPTKTAPKRPSPTDLQVHVSTNSNPPKKATPSSTLHGLGVRREPCYKCNLPVFIAERLNVGKVLYHRTCFRCARCDSQLTLANYYETENNEFCCETCPDEEKSTNKNNTNILNRSLSDEEKSASLKLDETDMYSDNFECALEFPKDLSLKRNFTLNKEINDQFSKSRNEFISNQIDSSSSSSDSDNESLDENTNPPTPPQQTNLHSENTNNINNDMLPSLSDSGLPNSKLDNQSENFSVTKDISANNQSLSIKSRIKLFENDNEIKSDVNKLSEVPYERETVNECSQLDLEDIKDEKINETILTVSSTITISDVNSSDDLKENSIISISSTEENVKETEESSSVPVEESSSVQIEESSSVQVEESSSVQVEESSSVQVEELKEYPDDLNPFGDDDNDGKEEIKVKPESLNPFGDSDDDEEEVSQPKLLLIPPKSSNPFGSDDEDEDEEIRPLPAQRKLIKPSRVTLIPYWEESPKPVAKPRTFVSPNKSNTSSPVGSARKKKPAPKPPTANQIFNQDGNDSPFSSITSSPSHSVCHSPKLTPKSRKLKRAPLPPGASSSTPVTFNLEEEKQSFSTLSPINQDMEEPPMKPLRFRVGSEENLKSTKNELNRTKQKTNIDFEVNAGPSSLPNKSTYGKWKRRKGQAPSRPIPQKRLIKSLPVNEIKQELEHIEVQQLGLEKQGVRLEKLIRERSEVPGTNVDEALAPEVEDMVLQLFELVNEKNELFRKQAELMYLRRQQRLEEEYAEIEYKIRCLMLQPEPNKTDSDKEKEEELINRLMEIVEQRNEIVDCVEMDRRRAVDEDSSISNQMSLFTQKRDESSSSTSKKSFLKKEKKAKKSKEKKSKSKSKVDADKDIDESETTSVVKEKKKKKKFLFSI